MSAGEAYPMSGAIAVLLLGEYGSGKSNFAMQWPRPWFLDLDGNLRDAARRFGTSKPWSWSRANESADGKPISNAQLQWQRMEALIREHGPKPEVGTIVVDGLTAFTDLLQTYLTEVGSDMEKTQMKVGGVKVMSQSLWAGYAILLRNFVVLCRSFGKPFILTGHLKVDADEMTSVQRYYPAIGGQMVGKLGGYFTDVWMTEARPGAGGAVQYWVRTAPTNRIVLKCQCGLPAEFQQGAPEWKAFLTSLEGGAK